MVATLRQTTQQSFPSMTRKACRGRARAAGGNFRQPRSAEADGGTGARAHTRDAPSPCNTGRRGANVEMHQDAPVDVATTPRTAMPVPHEALNGPRLRGFESLRDRLCAEFEAIETPGWTAG